MDDLRYANILTRTLGAVCDWKSSGYLNAQWIGDDENSDIVTECLKMVAKGVDIVEIREYIKQATEGG